MNDLEYSKIMRGMEQSIEQCETIWTSMEQYGSVLQCRVM